MLVVIYAKILYHSIIKTTYENFKSIFFTYLVQTKIWKLGCTCLIWAIERIKAVLKTTTCSHRIFT